MEARRVLEIEGPPGFGAVTFCGAGATSRVFRGVELATGRVVALKRLHRQLVRDDKALARLKRELEALRALRHPVLVEVADVIAWDGDPTLVMAFIDGIDLKEQIARRGRLSAEETTNVARALFDALSLTHGSGIVHRDVKPQNVRLTPDGKVTLLDFGSARLDAASQLTATGTTVGTPEYMAPELFAGPVYDPRVDVYGVGATLYECVTGRPAQTADSLAELAHLRTSVDIDPVRDHAPDVPEGLAHVIDRCLARDPEDRFPTAALAGWALDNPDSIRRLAKRRSTHPLCVHCGAAIPRESATCSVCKTDTPFRYVLGPSHVVLRSVENIGRFLEHVVQRFPHLGTPDELHALTETCAALSFGPQRYVSFVSDHNAEAIVAELAEISVRASIVREPVWWKSTLLAFAFPPYLPLRIPAALLHASGSMLAGSAAPRPVLPRVTSFAWWVLGVSLAVAFFSDSRAALFVATCAAFATLGGLVFGGRRARSDRAASPQPSGVFIETILASPAKATKLGEGAASPAFLVLAVGLLLFECIGLGKILDAVTHLRSWGPSTPVVTTTGPKQTYDVLPREPALDGPDEQPRSESSLPWELIPVGGALCAVGLAYRRRRRIRRDGAAIFAELDLPKLATLAGRTMPDRAEPKPTHALSYMHSPDGFTARAIQRASDLMPLLSPEQSAALASSVETLVRRTESQNAQEQSLLTRCILETDPAQKLRFDLLALEGALEAHAATEWAAQLEAEAEAASHGGEGREGAPARRRQRVRR